MLLSTDGFALPLAGGESEVGAMFARELARPPGTSRLRTAARLQPQHLRRRSQSHRDMAAQPAMSASDAALGSEIELAELGALAPISRTGGQGRVYLPERQREDLARRDRSQALPRKPPAGRRR